MTEEGDNLPDVQSPDISKAANLPVLTDAARLEQIRELRRSGADEYRLKERDIEREEIALLARTMPQQTIVGEAVERAAADKAQGLIAEMEGGSALIDQWNANGGLAWNLRQAQSSAEAVLEALHPDDKEDFLATFDAMPSSMRTAVFAELVKESPSGAKLASKEAMERFATIPEQAELLKSWRFDAARKLGILQHRLERLSKSMGSLDRVALTAWLDGLSPAAAKAVMSAMTRAA